MSDRPLEYESRTTPAPRWPRPWSRRRGIWTLVAVLGAPLFVAILLPNFGGPREPAHRVTCGMNLRQIGLAIQMYANDNKGRLPSDLATVMTSEDLTSEVFVCPSSADDRAQGPTTQAILQDFATPGHCSYTLASPLPTTWTALTPAHVVATESTTNHTDGGTNVLFGDGTVRWVNEPQAAHIAAELKAGFNPPRSAR